MALRNVSVITILVAATCLMGSAAAGRSPNGDYLEARLQASGGQFNDCLNAYQDLNSCSNLITQFFLTGDADISSCCDAIEAVTTKCSWPYTLPWFGYTPQESNILQAYCDAISLAPAPAPAPTSA